MGISPEFWGKHGWHFIHSIALAYPDEPTEEQINKYMAFFNSLHEVLPCPICGYHFKENMAVVPIRLSNKTELFNWTVDMHNEVNKQNGKKVLTYEEALNEILKNSETNYYNLIHKSNAYLLLKRIKNLKKK
jgi:hypothetical protein